MSEHTNALHEEMPVIFCSPLRYTQGPGATRLLGKEMKTLGLEGPVLIIAGSHAHASLEDAWKKTFEEVGFAYEVMLFGGESTIKEIDAGEERGKKLKARCVVGAGGGKVLDTSRAVASRLGVPAVNCPSVATSDAPCSALSIIYNDSHEMIDYQIYGRNPDLVLVDTALVLEAPPRLLTAGMGDALATMFEAKAAIKNGCLNTRGGRSTIAAEVIAEACYRTLLSDGALALEAVKAGKSTSHFERLVEANTLLSGLGFESSGLAAAHAIHNGLTTLEPTHDYYHGEKVSIGLMAQLILEEQPQSVIDEVHTFAASVGLPMTLEHVGLGSVSDDDLHSVAQRATRDDETIHNEPFEVTADSVFQAMRDADAQGRDWLKANV